jgi:hypothetical protein
VELYRRTIAELCEGTGEGDRDATFTAFVQSAVQYFNDVHWSSRGQLRACINATRLSIFRHKPWLENIASGARHVFSCQFHLAMASSSRVHQHSAASKGKRLVGEASRVYSGNVNSEGGVVFMGDQIAQGDIIINHFAAVRPLAKSLLRSFLESTEFFRSINGELASLIAVAEVTEDYAKEQGFRLDDNPRLRDFASRCGELLADLQRFKKKFDDTPSKSKVPWEMMEWNKAELESIRAQLLSNVNILTVINSQILKYAFHMLSGGVGLTDYEQFHTVSHRGNDSKVHGRGESWP